MTVSSLLAGILCESAKQLARVGGHAVDPAGIDLDAAIECAARLLKVDAVAFLE